MSRIDTLFGSRSNSSTDNESTLSTVLNMYTEPSDIHDKKQNRRHVYLSLLMLFFAAAIALLTSFSIANETLYSPFGILATEVTDSTYYFGLSIYITLGATLLTTALIRLALKLSK